jgi:hypothetical protein
VKWVAGALAVICVGFLATLFAFGGWLVATPDRDGGRQGFGTMLLIGCSIATVLIAAVAWGTRRRPDSH